MEKTLAMLSQVSEDVAMDDDDIGQIYFGIRLREKEKYAIEMMIVGFGLRSERKCISGAALCFIFRQSDEASGLFEVPGLFCFLA